MTTTPARPGPWSLSAIGATKASDQRGDGKRAESAPRSSARARRKRLRRTSQPCPAPPPSSTADIVPPLEVQPQLASTQSRKCECEGQDVVEQPEDQKTGKQFFGIVLPQRNQHGGVE